MSRESDHEEAAGLQGPFSSNRGCCRDCVAAKSTWRGGQGVCAKSQGCWGACFTTREEHIPSQRRTQGRLNREPPCLQIQWTLP